MADRWFEVELSLRGWIRIKVDGDLHDDETQRQTEQQVGEAAVEEVSHDWSLLNADWYVEECYEIDEAGNPVEVTAP